MLRAYGLADIMPMIFVGLAFVEAAKPNCRSKMIKTDVLLLAGRV